MTRTPPTRIVDDLISVAAHAEEELEEALAAHRLSRPSFLVLSALEDAPERTLNQRELVRRIRRTAGTMSVRLGRLERAGLIARQPDPGNRRSVTVTLTDRGRAFAAAARPAYVARAQRLLAPLQDEATDQLGRVLEAWLGFFEPGEGVAPRLGVAVATAAVAKRMRQAVGLDDVPGVLVVRVAPDSPAAAGGLARGDLITRAGDDPVSNIGDLQRAVATAGPSIRLAIVRGASERALDVSLVAPTDGPGAPGQGA